MNEIKNGGDFINNTVDTIKNSTNKIYQSTINFDFYKLGVLIGLIIVIILSIIVAYGLYWYISSYVYNQSKLLITETKIPILCTDAREINIQNFNKSGNGLRRTYTFWIYINDMNKYDGTYKHVWHIGDKNSTISTGSPYVFLDNKENKLYFRLGNLKVDSYTKITKKIQQLNPNDLNVYMRQGIVIDYVPIQRWVHIAIVINENSNGGSIVAYVDGDVSKVVNSGELGPTGNIFSITNLDIDKQGTLYVGGNITADYGLGFSGLISKITLFNYDLNDKDIFDNYNEGPIDNFLGLGRYGLRSPIYKLDDNI